MMLHYNVCIKARVASYIEIMINVILFLMEIFLHYQLMFLKSTLNAFYECALTLLQQYR